MLRQLHQAQQRQCTDGATTVHDDRRFPHNYLSSNNPITISTSVSSSPFQQKGRVSWLSTTTATSESDKKDNNDDNADLYQPPFPPSPREQTLMERSNKNVLERLYDKYSVSQQTNRILMAESFLQAATSQASDP
jgi:hypothetical protein